jgi:sugar lactone lactonase YvrE
MRSKPTASKLGPTVTAVAIAVGSTFFVAPTAAADTLPSAGGPTNVSDSCGAWSKSVVASGYGQLENLGFDYRGNLLLSEGSFVGAGAIHQLGAAGSKSVVAPNVTSPGGIVATDEASYFTTGNSATAGLFDTADGTVEALDPVTGEVDTVVEGLTMPNGLAVLPDGRLVVSRDLGASTTLTVIDPDTGSKKALAPTVTSTNGLAWDRTRELLWTSTLLSSVTTVVAIDVRSGKPVQTIELPGIGWANLADDLTVGPDGAVYLALNAAGSVVRVDPDTSTSCVIADGVPLVSAVEFGAGPGWDAASLYATSFVGTLTRLTPR